jgi:hypothetical protein
MKIHGIPVEFDPACRTVAQARGVWPFYRIVVGPHWYELEAQQRVATLMHEVGHCRGHHAVKRALAVPLVILWWLGEICGQRARAMTHQHELEADRFAADQGYARELAHALGRMPEEESPFYPNRDVRRSILLARHCKETFPC